jgi:hypothetical protein
MRKVLVFLLLLTLFVDPLVAYNPTDNEVKTALQALMVAAAASMAANQFPVDVIDKKNASYFNDTLFSHLKLTLNEADSGLMRQQILAQKVEPKRVGFLESLLSSVVRLNPSIEQLRAFLEPQSALKPKEAYFSGHLEANRYASPYFRYEASGSIEVWGERFENRFTLELSFLFPLEGSDAMKIIPKKVSVNQNDFRHVADQLFNNR